MNFLSAKLGLVLALVVLASLSPSSAVQITRVGEGPTLTSIGPLAFGPDGTLFAADNQGAAIFALDLGAHANGGAAGAKGLDAIDEKLAALLGTGASEISDHRSRGASEDAQRLRVGDAWPGRRRGAGAVPHRRRRQIANVPLKTLRFQRSRFRMRRLRTRRRGTNPRTQVVTDMAFADSRLWVAGLSNEEFASKLRAIPYPFASVDPATASRSTTATTARWRRARPSTRSCPTR